ncbi:2Fe-2S iron-sulfur cluster-binding protein [Ensifer adhaerens]|uniref:2Fe-2S iron-sulfur cluster-binding protein n=1 Tax=Ensifer adhaerens TaxID=106592 RepID=UPI000CF15DC6|nr:2Fe-2S iron-sulfur cluster-binding protein [Ensifer adhaerens]
MIEITFIEAGGQEITVTAPVSGNLMHIGQRADVAGMLGECGGTCGCGTCHVYVEQAWLDRLPPIADDEADMLSLSDGLRSESRLACQIKISSELHGLRVQMPDLAR